MSTGPTETKVVWTRSGARKRDLVLVGRLINAKWTEHTVPTLQVWFSGPLWQALNDLLLAAKSAKNINLPIGRLRASMMAGLVGVVTLDRDLGALPRPGAPSPCALDMYEPVDGAESVREGVHGILKRWCLDVLGPWAASHEFDDLAQRVRKAVLPQHILSSPAHRPLVQRSDSGSKLDFPLAVREIGERLADATLFGEELGPCNLIVSPEAPSNYIELMTTPRRGADGRNCFSMVARVSIVTVPYVAGHVLKVAAAKRVWAKRVPGNKPNAPRRVTGYVLGPGRPVLPVSVLRDRNGWEFGEDFVSVRLLADGQLPETLLDALARQQPDASGWWAGLPELTTLFDSVSPRTVFEADEVDLMNEVAKRVKGIADSPVDFVAHKLPRGQAKSAVKMLNLADVGLAGASLDGGADDTDDEVAEPGDGDELDKLGLHREQNVRALQLVHGSAKPTLWCIGGTPDEQDLIRKSVQALFGDALALKTEVLPAGAHGLRDNLPGREGTARARFEARIAAWRPLAEHMAAQAGPRFALICAPDREGRKTEDIVNYYAGMHAMCALGNANVHHVLPVESPDSTEAKQNFVHRLQSALLDVFLAHSGVVFGVAEFLRARFNGNPPRATYGIQAVRSRARPFSGESDVYFFVATRLLTSTGVTQVQFFYRSGAQNRRSPWLPLAEGLRWLGSQRHLSSGDEPWLKGAFKDFLRETLASIALEDPRALVLIDWENVAGLWRGIRDADLKTDEPPRLDEANLAATYPQMSFVRIRRGYDVLSLRGLARETFEGWREDAARETTGERFVDEYPTTTKNIVEIMPSGASGERRSGHFVASMGYSKTSQVKRGFSCYRPMIRMTPIREAVAPGDKKARYFEKKTLEPANMDASVPAPLDITVMSSPADVPPSEIAIAVMGLRLGYAHYNDWTTLPAPLFFKRKIEDYIIRYSEAVADVPAEAESVEAEAVPVEEAVLAEAAETKLSQAVVEEVLPPPPAVTAAAAEVPPGPDDEKQAVETVDGLGDEIDDDLLYKPPFPLYESGDPKLNRLYQAMMQDNGAHIRVELPSFVTAAEAFGSMSLSYREFQRVWDRTRDFGFVKQTASRPRLDDLAAWMMARLARPQAAHSLFAVRLGVGPFFFKPIQAIVERYNLEAAEPLPLATRSFFELGDVARWACAKKDDYAVAWLLFAAAQFPGYGCGEKILDGISELPGPLSDEAAAYLIDCVEAVDKALEHISEVGRGFPPIVIRRSVTAQHPTGAAVPEAASATLSQPPHPVAERAESHATELESSNDLKMNIDRELLSALSGLEPGSDDFPSRMTRIRARLAELEGAHGAQLEQRERLRKQAETVQQLEARASELLVRVRAQRPELALPEISLRQPAVDRAQDVAQELDAVGAALDAVQKWREVDRELRACSLPSTASLMERRARTEQESKVLDAIFDGIVKLEGAVRACSAFSLGADAADGCNECAPAEPEPTTTPPSGGGAQQPTEAPAGLPQAEGPQVPVAEAEQAAAIGTPTPPPTPTAVDAHAKRPPAQPAEIAASTAEAPRQERGAAEEEPVEPIRLNEALRTRHFATLSTLVDQRRYGLAAVHARALAELLAQDTFASHRVVLNALFGALESIDCKFAVDARLDADLKQLLKDGIQTPPSECDVFSFSAGILGASIVSMLFEGPNPENRWDVLSYLQTRFAGHEALGALAEHIGHLDRTDIVLTRDGFAASRIGATSAMAAELKRMSQRAAAWSRDPEIHSLWNNRTYKGIHEEMFSPQYPVGQCLALIAKEDFSRLPQAFAEAKRKFDKPGATLDELTRRAKVRVTPDGKPRVWFIENLETSGEFVSACVDLVHKRSSPNTQLASNVQAYLEGLYVRLQRAAAELEHLRAEHILDHIYTRSAATVLRSVLRLFEEDRAPACVPVDQQLLLVQLPMGRDFMPSMACRLAASDEGATAVCEPEEVLAETQRLAEEELVLNSEAEDSGLGPALRDAARSHADSHRFLPAFAIAAMYPKTFGSGEASLAALHQRARNALDSDLHGARQRVAHAMALSALEAAEANRMLRVIEDIQAANGAKASIGQPDGESAAYPDFPHAKAALRRQVLDLLDKRLTNSKGKLEHQVAAYEAAHGHEAARDIARIREMLSASSASSLRTAHDLFYILQKEGRLPPPTASGRTAADVYEEFQRKLKADVGTHRGLLEALTARLAAEPEQGEPEWLERLDAAGRDEAKRFLDHWTGLFKPLPQTEEKLKAFFSAIGTASTPSCMQTSAYTAGRVGFHFAASPIGLDSDAHFIPPNLGSKGVDVRGYVLLGRPGAADIRQVIQDAAGGPTFVLARANLTLESRAALSVQASALIIDDELVAYLALHRGKRIQKLLEVGLLTYRTNPYADYGGVPVPPEMFFGRQTELSKLREVKNAAILYGGRRLGKSSLLDQVEREGSARPGSAAVYISMDGARYEQDHVTYAWGALYKALCDHNVIQRMPQAPKDWKAAQNWIERELSASKTIRSCYLLLDEADALMGRELASAPGAPSFVRSLQQLCESVQKRCHLRYVIAGLHNITRMSTEENSPLGKAEAIALEPFNSADDIQRGIELVTKPLAALGFHFDKGSEDLPLRILSVCNFYPAFIQLYCHSLLERLYNVRQAGKPPTYVTAKDLDAVERDGNLLTELQRKFELNLNLDKRYKAIALILADVFYTESDAGHYRGLTTSQIREYCETYAAPHFAHTGPGAYEALVDEMRKLSVLERVGSRYVLRNPNIAMMMGDRDRISHHIDELARETPEQARNHGERRIHLTRRHSQRQLFPLPAAWVRTNVEASDGDLLILVGNNLSGLPEIANLQEEWTLAQYCLYQTRILPTPQSADSFLRNLRDATSDTPPKRLIAASPTSWKVAAIAEYAAVAAKMQRRARLALVALPDKAYELAKAIESGELAQAEDGTIAGVRIVPVPPWTEDAVHFLLEENVAVAESSDACRALLEASCGFGSQVTKLCAGPLTVEQARTSPQTAETTFLPDLETLYQKIGMPASVDAATRSRLQDFLLLLDDGVEKKSAAVRELMRETNVGNGLMQFMVWMGLLQDGPANTWKVPRLVRRVLP